MTLTHEGKIELYIASVTWKIKTKFLGELWRNLNVEVRAEAEKGKKKIQYQFNHQKRSARKRIRS